MKDEALAAEGSSYRLDLRRVGTYRQEQVAGSELLVQIVSLIDFHIDGRVHHAAHQAGDYRALCEYVGVGVDIIPHYELVEGEVTQDGLLDHIPVLLLHDLRPYRIEYQRNVYAASVLRQRVKSPDGNIEHLAQKLQKRDVQHCILIPDPEHIPAGCRPPDKLDRHKKHRGISRLLAERILIPSEQAECQIQRIGSVLFHRGLCCSIQVGKGYPQRALLKICMYPVLPEFLLDDLVDRVSRIDRLIEAVAQELTIPILRLRTHSEVLVIGQGILQHADIGRYERDRAFCHPEIEKVIPEGQVKKLPLPDDLLADYSLGIYDKVSRAHIRRSGICPWFIIVFDHIVAFIIDGPERQRPDLAYPGPAHIEEVHEFLRVHYLVSGRIASLVEARLAAFVHGGTFHDEYLVHAISHALGNQRWVVIYAVRERIRNQPAARKGMIICQDHQRMQAGRLKAAGIQHRHIQTVTHLEGHDIIHCPDPLSLRLEAGRRDTICDSLLGNGLVDCGHLVFHPVRIPALIGIQ